jgi:tRNA A-37 threonylcarbamoyl transferase component Bud32
MTLAAVKPGRYKPRCVACQAMFVLTIPDPTPLVCTLEEDAKLQGRGDSPHRDAAGAAGNGVKRNVAAVIQKQGANNHEAPPAPRDAPRDKSPSPQQRNGAEQRKPDSGTAKPAPKPPEAPKPALNPLDLLSGDLFMPEPPRPSPVAANPALAAMLDGPMLVDVNETTGPARPKAPSPKATDRAAADKPGDALAPALPPTSKTQKPPSPKAARNDGKSPDAARPKPAPALDATSFLVPMDDAGAATCPPGELPTQPPASSLGDTTVPGAARSQRHATAPAARRTAPVSSDATHRGIDQTQAVQPAGENATAGGFAGTENLQPSAAAQFDKTEIYTASPSQPADAALPADAPRSIGGYRLIKELGRGAMGAVFLARQVSLDRKVALKVIQPQMASDPLFISRFTREAYAAAQLTHHNIVQVYDLGASSGHHFFSMEFVEGRTLGNVVREQGRLEAETAAGFVLQAARGLQFAHEHGMVHRDIKPDNLLVNNQGIVKVADLGLVKTRHVGAPTADAAGTANDALHKTIAAEQTIADVAMGTPAYMPPEQAEDAAAVDHRADIYSLGCTLYALLTGRPPFEGASAIEVITKHRSEPMVRPEALVKRVPPQLSEINMRMVAKRPEDRPRDLGEVIEQLEGYLGVRSSGPLSPGEEHVEQLERCAAAFQGGRWQTLRPKLLLGFLALCGVAAAAGLAMLNLWLLAGGLGLAVTTTAAYFVASGWLDRTFLFAKVRQWLFSVRVTDVLVGLAAAALVVLLLYLCNLLIASALLLALALALGVGFHLLVDRRVARERAAPLADAERLLKSLRLRGLKEDAVRDFVARYCGENWEEIFESLFGYQAKLAARRMLDVQRADQKRKKFRAWRDPLIERIDARLDALRQARERRHLQKLEQAALEAAGVDRRQAQQQAQQAADALVDQATELREIARLPSAADAATRKRAAIKNMLAATRAAGEQRRRSMPARIGRVARFLFGGKMRFALGAGLLAVCVLWLHQNGLIPGRELPIEQIKVTSSEQREALLRQLQSAGDVSTQPLALLPAPLDVWLSNLNTGIAGLILLLSVFWPGLRPALFALAAAAAASFAPLACGEYLQFLPSFGVLNAGVLVGAAAGTCMVLVGWLVGRRMPSSSA